MFATTPLHIYHSENADSIQRKPGPNQLSRKPFIDRSVNGKSPTDRKLLSKTSPKQPDISLKQKISPKISNVEYSYDKDLDADYFIYSGKELQETYNDVWPSLTLNKEVILAILKNYSCTLDTLPPSPPPDFKVFNTEFDAFDAIDSHFFELPKPILCDESFEVDIPQIQTFEDLDDSF